MQSERTRRSVLLPIAGLVLLIPPVFFTARWMLVANRVTTGQADRVKEFLSLFPSALRDARLLTWIGVLFAASATVAGLVGIVRSTGALRFLNLVPLLVGGLLTLWLLFTLM